MAGMTAPVRTIRRLAVLTAIAALAAGCGQSGGSHGTASAGSRPSATASAGSSASAGPSPSASPSAATVAWPVVLPVPAAMAGQHQTRVRPSAQSADFHAEMTDLWAAVASDRPRIGLVAFYPLVAYEQVKNMGDPEIDWRYRLVAEYDEDIRAAHGLLNGKGREAKLVRVIVPESQADWIYPGVCDNLIGYWHVANARMVYRIGDRTRSFGIATLISWRGRWYVVHFGGELRTSGGGMVDQPEAGPGAPGPPGGC